MSVRTQNQQVVGQERKACIDQGCRKGRFAVTRVAEDTDRACRSSEHGGVQRLDALLEEHEGEHVTEEVGRKRLTRALAQGGNRNVATVG
jgi:hypothetical protein